MTLDGIDALKRAVTESPKEMRLYASRVIRETTFQVADKMRASVPVDTGTLLAAIEAKVPVRGLTGRVIIEPEGFYWRFLEYGTIKKSGATMAARPFVRPSVEAESSRFVERIQGIARDLESFWSRQ